MKAPQKVDMPKILFWDEQILVHATEKIKRQNQQTDLAETSNTTAIHKDHQQDCFL
jgi:hypothetical protein